MRNVRDIRLYGSAVVHERCRDLWRVYASFFAISAAVDASIDKGRMFDILSYVFTYIFYL